MAQGRNLAILVVDTQFDSFSGTPHQAATDRAKPTLQAIEMLLAVGRRHSIDICFSRHLEGPMLSPANVVRILGRESGASSERFRPGSAGAHLAVGAAPNEPIFDKFSWSAFGSEALESHLEILNPELLVICGFQTEVCVLATVFGAFERGYSVVVPLDAVGTRDGKDEAHAFTLSLIADYLAKVTSVSELCRQIPERGSRGKA